MQDFFRLIHPHKDRFSPVRVNSSYIKLTQDITIELLRVKDLNGLRDRFEGVRFYNKILTLIFSRYALESLLNIPCVDIDKIKRKDFSNTIIIGDRIIAVNAFTAEDLPVVDSETDYPTIFIMKRNESSGWLCGYMDADSLASPLNYKKTGLRKEFIGFKNLQQFGSVTELESLLLTDKVIS